MSQITKGRTLQTKTNSNVVLVLNPKQSEGVNKLIETGCWGNTATQCIIRILDAKLIKENKNENSSN